MKKGYEEYYGLVANLLDDEPIFEEFASDISNMNSELVDATNNFAMHLGDRMLNSFTYTITALIIINILCQSSNKKLSAQIVLSELDVFNAYFEDTIDLAKEASAQTGYSVEDCLHYGFVYANYLMSLGDDNDEILKIYKKDIIKPIKKQFKRDYISTWKLKRKTT